MTLRWLPALLFIVTGCAQQYAPPSAEEPHGVIKFRRSYQETKGQRLVEKLDVGEERAFVYKGKPKVAKTTRTDAITVTPGRQEITAFAEFSSIYSNGDSSSKVVHGKCKETVPVTVEAGGVYLLQMNYQNKRVCMVECYRQTPSENGQLSNTPCE